MTILETTSIIICCLLAVIAVAQGIMAVYAIKVNKDSQLLHDANENYRQIRKEFIAEIDRLRNQSVELVNDRNYWMNKCERMQRSRTKKSTDAKD